MKRLTTIAVAMLCFMAGAIAASYWQDALAQAQDGKREQQHKGHHMALSGDMQKDMQMMNKMMVDHLGEKDNQYEARFIDMMIPHHEGAVMMSEHAVKHANRPELKEMAQKMIKEQSKEIEQLRQWRKDWYGAASKGKGKKQ